MHDAKIPLYVGERSFLGKSDLVISFYSKKCSYGRCTFCAIPNNSSIEPISEEDINSQIDYLFEKYSAALRKAEQFSVGNEGSILDEHTFPRESLEYLIEKINHLGSAQILSLETRAEYIHEDDLARIKDMFNGGLDVTVGFETQDDFIRNFILNKGLTKEFFESKINILSNLDTRMTSYVMMKPSPYMTEYEGIMEAERTIDYLSGLSKRVNIDLVIYLIPTYMARNTSLGSQMKKEDYKPPLMSSVRRVAQYASKIGLPVYLGLWSEGLAESDGISDSSNIFEARALRCLKLFNKTPETSLLYSPLY